jgi:hypothetical protein
MSPYERADHWRHLSTDTLLAAAETTDPQLREVLISISVIYGNLARKAEAAEPSLLTVVPVVLIKKPDD